MRVLNIIISCLKSRDLLCALAAAIKAPFSSQFFLEEAVFRKRFEQKRSETVISLIKFQVT
jgi:hypothetical protein